MVSTRSTRGSPPTAALLPVPGKAVSLEGAEKDTDTGYYVNFRGRSPLHAAQRAAREAIEVFAARRGVKVALRFLTPPYEPVSLRIDSRVYCSPCLCSAGHALPVRGNV